MGAYIPLFQPGQGVTLQAGAAITGGQLVEVTAANQVSPTAGATKSWVGVAGFDAAVGDDVTVYGGGLQRCIASAAIAVGDTLVSAAAGEVAVLADAAVADAAAINASRQIVGIALTAAAAQGDIVDVKFNR